MLDLTPDRHRASLQLGPVSRGPGRCAGSPPATREPPVTDPQKRGLSVLYREGQTNYCPGCGRTHWHVGRVSAECAFCSTALPLESAETGSGIIRKGQPANG